MALTGSRYYRRVAPRQAPQQGGDIGRGFAAGQMVGNALGQFGTAIKSMRADQVANQLLAQKYPDQPGTSDPNADLSTDLPEDVSTDIGGIGTDATQGNLQGGVDELKARQAADASDLDTQIKQAQLANSLAKLHGTDSYAARAEPAPQGYGVGRGSSSRWSQYGGNQDNQGNQYGQQRRGNKPAPYVPGSVDAENDDSADDMTKVAADFDSAMGGQKGTYAKFIANAPNLKPDANGNFTLLDKNGNVAATVLKDDVPHWLNRTNAARRNQGLGPIQIKGVPLGQGANPASTENPGSSATNPIVLTSKIQPRALPYGTFVKDPNTGQTFTINRPPSS